MIYCIDAICYHMGGPLGAGDIEDLCLDNEISCGPIIKCPWHFHKIDLSDGSKLNQSVEFDEDTKQTKKGPWIKNSNFQRVHKVEQRADGLYIYVTWLDDNVEQQFKSDSVAMNKASGDAIQNSSQNIKTKSLKQHPGADGKRSGDVFLQRKNC